MHLFCFHRVKMLDGLAPFDFKTNPSWLNPHYLGKLSLFLCFLSVKSFIVIQLLDRPLYILTQIPELCLKPSNHIHVPKLSFQKLHAYIRFYQTCILFCKGKPHLP